MHIEPAGNRLAELRRKHGLKLVEVAAHINRDQSVIYRYETGKTQIPDDVKRQLADLFGVTRAQLMGWDETESRAS
jgi:transcriptional regulator with XRE-family HTH domain